MKCSERRGSPASPENQERSGGDKRADLVVRESCQARELELLRETDLSADEHGAELSAGLGFSVLNGIGN